MSYPKSLISRNVN